VGGGDPEDGEGFGNVLLEPDGELRRSLLVAGDRVPKGSRMKKRCSAEQIVGLLRLGDVDLGKRMNVPDVCTPPDAFPTLEMCPYPLPRILFTTCRQLVSYSSEPVLWLIPAGPDSASPNFDSHPVAGRFPGSESRPGMFLPLAAR
jgi:hypothetical protein